MFAHVTIFRTAADCFSVYAFDTKGTGFPKGKHATEAEARAAAANLSARYVAFSDLREG